MAGNIRAASAADLDAIVAFFEAVFESRHGIGTLEKAELALRTEAMLFGESENPALTFVHESLTGIEGVVAIARDDAPGDMAVVTLQTADTVRGRGIAQRLLEHAADLAAGDGAERLTAVLAEDDHRARGFVRREGFVVTPPADPTAPMRVYARTLR